MYNYAITNNTVIELVYINRKIITFIKNEMCCQNVDPILEIK